MASGVLAELLAGYFSDESDEDARPEVAPQAVAQDAGPHAQAGAEISPPEPQSAQPQGSPAPLAVEQGGPDGSEMTSDDEDALAAPPAADPARDAQDLGRLHLDG